MHLVAGQQIGKYTTLEFLGAGVFGSVYLLHDNLMNRDVAVKFVQNQNPAAFVAHYEAQILHQCRHDRIVPVNSVDVIQDTQGRYYAAIEMEYVPNGSAQKLIETTHVSIRQAIKITIDLLFALGHAHRQGVLHRDVKPANVLLAGSRGKPPRFRLKKIGYTRIHFDRGSPTGTPCVRAEAKIRWAPMDIISPDCVRRFSD
jgi:serine/threonine protein kinase